MTEKALLITEYFPPVIGGSPRWFDVVVRHAATLEWTVITQPVEGAPARESIGRHRVIRPKWWSVPPSPLKVRTLVAYARMARYFSKLIRPGEFSVVHAMPAYGAAFPASLFTRRRNIPLVVHVFGEEFGMQGRSLYRRSIMRRTLGSARAVVANSERTRAQAIAHGAPADRSHVIFSIDLEALKPIPRPEARARLGLSGGPFLLTVGRIVERKGHDLVIRSLAELSRRFPGLQYLIAGEGPDRGRLEAMAAKEGVADLIRFLGRIPEDHLASVYSAADLFVMPNRELSSGEIEGLGFVFLEAAACGTPSIGGRSGGTASAIRDGETGLLVDPTDTAALTEAITGLLNDPARRERFTASGLDFVRSTCSISRMIERLEGLHR